MVLLSSELKPTNPSGLFDEMFRELALDTYLHFMLVLMPVVFIMLTVMVAMSHVMQGRFNLALHTIVFGMVLLGLMFFIPELVASVYGTNTGDTPSNQGPSIDWSQVFTRIGVVAALAVLIWMGLRYRKHRAAAKAEQLLLEQRNYRRNKADLRGLQHAMTTGLISEDDLRQLPLQQLQDRIDSDLAGLLGDVFNEIVETVKYYRTFDRGLLKTRKEKREFAANLEEAQRILAEMYDAPDRVRHAATLPARREALQAGREALEAVDAVIERS